MAPAFHPDQLVTLYGLFQARVAASPDTVAGRQVFFYQCLLPACDLGCDLAQVKASQDSVFASNWR